jgi:hypothetical protein
MDIFSFDHRFLLAEGSCRNVIWPFANSIKSLDVVNQLLDLTNLIRDIKGISLGARCARNKTEVRGDRTSESLLFIIMLLQHLLGKQCRED